MASQIPRRKGLWQSLLDYINGTQDTVSAVTYETPQVVNDEPLVEEAVPEPVYENLDTIFTSRPGQVHLHGVFKNVRTNFTKNRLLVTNAIFSDSTGSVRAVWFKANVAPFLRHDGLYEVRGKLELKNGAFQLAHPEFRKLSNGCEPFANQTKIENKTEKQELTTVKNLWTTDINGKGLSEDSKWKALKNKVILRDGGKCVECGSKVNLTVDHIVEGSIGGSNDMSNLHTLCKDCHEDKHGRKFLERGFDADDNYGDNFIVTKKIKTLVNAKDSHTSVRISYVDRDGVHTYRTIHPKVLYKGYHGYNKSKVYVDAYCELDKAGRTFRVSRMTLV